MRDERTETPSRSRSRRRLLTMGMALAGAAMARVSPGAQAQAGQGSGESARAVPAEGSPPDVFPRLPPDLAREIVGVSHGNLARVKELVGARPALARASWDWGFGDWETALGAASHVGNKDIAAVLLAAGAHPTIFSAAMLGQLDTVKAFVAASPGIQRTRGPHGITLLAHARTGGNADVVRFLDQLGDADPRYPSEPLAEADQAALLGTYTVQSVPGSAGAGQASGVTHRLVVSVQRGLLSIKGEGESDRTLFHHGGRVFNPAGAEAVRIAFEPETGPVRALTVSDGPMLVRAVR